MRIPSFRSVVRRRLHLACVLALAGCVGEAQLATLKDLQRVQRELADAYKQPVKVAVMNGSDLTLTFGRMPASDSLAVDEWARAAATLAARRYSQADRLERIHVAFQEVRSAGPVTITRDRGRFTFAAADLR